MIIALIVGAVVVAFSTIIGIATFYKAPTCTDNTQNQGEAGIDCGSPCAYLCTAQVQPPTVLFTKALTNSAGRTDIIASIENKNIIAAAKNVPYRVALYGADQILIQQVTGTLDLPPGATEPVYIPGILSGRQTVVNAFLSIDSSAPQWFTMARDPRIVPSVSSVIQKGSISAPRIEVTLGNRSPLALTNVRVIVLVRDAHKDVIAASQTIVPAIPAQGSAAATFTWNSAFPGIPASIEVVPIIPLP